MSQPENAASVTAPALVIRNGQVENDTWLNIHDAEALAAAPAGAAVLVPLSLWLSSRAALLARGQVGVHLGAADEPAQLAPDLASLTLISVDFPQFTDGRGYSIGRLLRERYGYQGELRAVGDVQRDQLFYLTRSGFNAFVLRADKDPYKALTAHRDFSEAYQTAVDQPVPLFRRRQAVLAGRT